MAKSDDDSKSDEIWVIKFDEEAAQKFRDTVVAQSKLDPHKPLVIHIDSYGGYVDSLVKMIETIDELPNPVITVCMGKAMSCGAVLLSHGDLRFCGKHSRIMVHEVSSGTWGDVHDVYNDAQETKRLNAYINGLMAKNCGFKSYDEFRKWMKEQDGRDRYMNAEQAVKFGIVDSVGLPKITTTTIHEVRIETSKPRRPENVDVKRKSDPKKGHRRGGS